MSDPPPAGDLRSGTSEVLLAVAGLIVGWAAVGVIQALGVIPATGAGAAFGLVLGPVAVAVGALIYRALANRVIGAAPTGPTGDAAPSEGIPTRAGATAGVVVLHVIAAIVGSELLAWTLRALGAPVAEQKVVLDILRRGLALRPDLVALCLGGLVLAPLAEELFFRLLLFRRVRAAAGRVPAYFASALGFALIHQNPVGLLVYAWLGLVFASALERTRRPIAPILVHFGNNGVALSILLYQAHTGTLPT